MISNLDAHEDHVKSSEFAYDQYKDKYSLVACLDLGP